jgi:thiol-disulfide isomerase/thioredoxin
MRIILIFAILICGLFLTNSPVLSNKKSAVAPSFTLTNIEGKKVSLSDFKGKVIYMDVWASWCGPCILEMKSAKKVKEHFKDNKNIVFLYISIDKDEQSWKDMVEKKDIKGIHLISKGGMEEGILQKYDVPAIPKFVLIDKEGNIADANAKWPSDSDIIDDIQKLLPK